MCFAVWEVVHFIISRSSLALWLIWPETLTSKETRPMTFFFLWVSESTELMILKGPLKKFKPYSHFWLKWILHVPSQFLYSWPKLAKVYCRLSEFIQLRAIVQRNLNFIMIVLSFVSFILAQASVFTKSMLLDIWFNWLKICK